MPADKSRSPVRRDFAADSFDEVLQRFRIGEETVIFGWAVLTMGQQYPGPGGRVHEFGGECVEFVETGVAEHAQPAGPEGLFEPVGCFAGGAEDHVEPVRGGVQWVIMGSVPGDRLPSPAVDRPGAGICYRFPPGGQELSTI